MFKLLFKNMKGKDWVSVVAVFLLTLCQVFFMMQIVSYISLLTGAVQASREKGVAEIWWYGLYMVICAILMAGTEVTIRFVASARASFIISLYFVSSPPTRVLSPAPMSRSAFTVWIVLPLTMPSGSSCLPGMVSVVTINKFAHLHFPE